MKMITKLISTTFKHFYMRVVNSEQNAYLKMHYLHRAKSCSNL